MLLQFSYWMSFYHFIIKKFIKTTVCDIWYCSIYFHLCHEIQHYHCHELCFVYCNICPYFHHKSLKMDWRNSSKTSLKLKHGLVQLAAVFITFSCLLLDREILVNKISLEIDMDTWQHQKSFIKIKNHKVIVELLSKT